MPRDPSKYVIDGKRVVSVTRALALAGLVDYGAIQEEVLEFARIRGNDVHAWLQGVAVGVLKDLEPDPRIRGYVDGYARFRDDKQFEVVAVEEVVLNDTYRYAGMLDRRGVVDDERWLFDLKCVSRVQPESALQTAAYEHCLKERHKRAVLQLLPNGTYKIHEYTSRNDLHDFLSALRVAWRKIAWGRATIEEEN